jgi:hypothetical protein
VKTEWWHDSLTSYVSHLVAVEALLDVPTVGEEAEASPKINLKEEMHIAKAKNSGLSRKHI